MYENRLDYLLEELFINPSDDNRLYKFLDPSNWIKANVETRTRFIKTFIDTAGFAIEGLPMGVSRSDFNDAHLKITDGQILISNKAIRNSRTAFPFIRDYFFQLKFQDQLDYIRGKDIDRMYEREHEYWWHNNNATPANDYERCMLKESDPNYHYQPLVASAHDFANKSIKELARMIYKKNGYLSRELQDFLVGELPNYHIYDNKKKREEIYEEIETKSNFFEEEKYEVWELLMPGSEGVEGLSDEQLLLGLLPPVQMLHELEFDQEVTREIILRELNKYKITKNIKIEYNSRHNFINCVNNIYENIINNIDQVGDLSIHPLLKDLGLPLNIYPVDTIEHHMEPMIMFKRNLHQELHDRVLENAKKFTNNERFTNDLDKLSVSNTFDPYERIIEEYYGIPATEFYNKLVESIKNGDTKNFKIEAKRDLDFESELRSKILEVSATFHSENYDNISNFAKGEIFLKLDGLISEHYGVPRTLVLFSDKLDKLGKYAFGEKTDSGFITINTESQENSYRFLLTYLHEKRHQLQQAAIKGTLDYNKLGISKEELELMKMNVQKYLRFNIKHYKKEMSKEYAAQPIESDAFKWSNKLTYELVKDITGLVGEDKKLPNFLYEMTRKCYYSQQPESNHNKVLSDLRMTWEAHREMVYSCERFLESGRKNLNNLGSLSDKQLMSYFNEYTWMSLEQAERLQVIEEIENRETGGNKREKINMNYYGFISSVAYNVPIHLETYYTQTFEKEAKYIIDSEKQETPSTLVKALLRYLARYNPTWKGYKNGLYRDIFNSYDEEEHVRNPLLSKLNIADIYFFKYMYDKLTKAEDILRGDPLFNQLEWDKVLTKYDYKRFIKDVEHLLDKSKEELIIDNDNDIYKTINTR